MVNTYGIEEEEKVTLGGGRPLEFKSTFDVDRLIKELDDIKIAPMPGTGTGRNDISIINTLQVRSKDEEKKEAASAKVTFPVNFSTFTVSDQRKRTMMPKEMVVSPLRPRRSPKFELSQLDEFF